MKNRNIIISCILTLALCFSLITGATFALFTSKAESNIAVTSGKVQVTAAIDTATVETKQLYFDYQQGADHMSPDASVTIKEADITLDKIIPGDGVKFNINITNNSDVAIKYRVVLTAADGGSINGLAITINENTYTGSAVNGTWKYVEATSAIDSIPVSIELPDSQNNNDYQGATTKIVVRVEALQGNAEPAPDGTLADLKAAFFDDAVIKDGVATVTLTQNYDGKGWTALTSALYEEKTKNACNSIIIEGGNFTIYNLDDSLIDRLNSVEIRNLTLKDTKIEKSKSTASNNQGIGAFMNYTENATAKFENCNLTASAGKTSIVTCTDGYAGGFVGYSSTQDVEFKNCSVSNANITGMKSVGGLVGHIGAKTVIADNCSITNSSFNEMVEDEQRDWGVGAVAGRVTGATLTMTNITESDNAYNVKNPSSTASNNYVGLITGCTVTLDGEQLDDVIPNSNYTG